MAKERQQSQLDATARYAIKLAPSDVLHWVVPGLSADLSFRRWLDTEMIAFPGEPRRRCDTVAQLFSQSGKGPPWALALEVEARPRGVIEGRLAESLVRLFRKVRYGEEKDPYQVAGALIVLTGKQRPLRREMKLPGTPLTFGWHLEVMNVSTKDARKTLGQIGDGTLGKGILPWVPLMTGADEAAVAEEWAKLAATETNEETRRDHGGLAQVFAGHLGRSSVWDRVLEGWQVSDSKVIMRYMNQASVRTRREDLVRTIELKYEIVPPADLIALIQQNDSLDSLAAWRDSALRAATIDAFRLAIQPAEKRTGASGS